MMKILTSQLREATVELNHVLGLEPEIDSELEVDVLLTMVRRAAELVEPEDVFTSKTTMVLEVIKGEVEVVETIPAEERSKKVEKPKKARKAKKSIAPKQGTVFNPTKCTRADALIMALREFENRPFVSAEIIARSREIYSQENGVEDKDDKGAAAQWLVNRGVFTAYGYLKKAGQNVFIYSEAK